MAKKEEISDAELFDIADVKVRYERSKDQKTVTATLKSEQPICEMKLYLVYDREMQILERRLGISDIHSELH